MVSGWLSNWAPSVAVARQQFVGAFRPVASGGIVRKLLGFLARPGIKHRIDDLPRGLDLIGSLKECGVADEAIIDQRLITDGRAFLEPIRVMEIHGHALKN